MTKREAKKLPDGLYEIYWKRGGMSLAAKGETGDGDVWFAPCNWITGSQIVHPGNIKQVVLIRERDK